MTDELKHIEHSMISAAHPRMANAERGNGGRGSFVQEDSPDEIGRAIARWMGALR